jgi:hypothetical protein
MPRKNEAQPAVCDGCGMERADVVNDLCPDCAARRANDPAVTVQGRALTVSELEMQADDDKDLAAALDGDSVQDQIKAAKR